MNTSNILKEYLVSLGFSVNDSSFNQFRRAMNSAGGEVEGFASKSISSFAKAAAGFTSFIVTVNAGIAKYISGLGQADLQTQIFARRMWMSVDAARAYQSSLNALGANLQDLYLSPELMQRYLSLRNEALGMQMNDKDYETAMKGVRDMTFEFQRLKLEGSYALQWIGFYLTKYIEPVLKDSGLSLKNINDLIQQKMPEWTQKVAQFASWFVKLGAAAWDARDALAAIMAVIMAPKLISLATNPVFLMIAGLTTLLLLFEDYRTYASGGESAFPQLWKSLDDNGSFKVLKEGFSDIKSSLGEVLTSLKELGKVLDESGATNVGIMALNSSFEILGATLKSIAGLITIIAGGIDGISTNDWSTLQKGLKMFVDGVPKDLANNINGALGTGGKDDTDNLPMDNFTRGIKQYQEKNGIGKTSFGLDSEIELLSSSQGNSSWGKKIYDILTAYIPQIASSLGVNTKNNGNGQSQLSLMDIADKISKLTSNAQSGATWVNYSPWNALYNNNSNTSHSAQVNVKSTFNISGAKDPNTTARVVESNQTQAITRAYKGGIY